MQTSKSGSDKKDAKDSKNSNKESKESGDNSHGDVSFPFILFLYSDPYK
jgi:hypothetical protein